MELHPLCTLFPRMGDFEFAALVEDIKAHGLLSPIVTYEGMILDGGNRYRACIEAGVPIDPVADMVEYQGGKEGVVSFVLSSNFHRRHLTIGQQAAIVAACQDWALADQRGGDRVSEHFATLRLATTADRAAASGAGVRTQWMADKVAKSDPELLKEVASGAVSLPDAVRRVDGKEPRKAPKERDAGTEQLLAKIEELKWEVGERKQEVEDLRAMLDEQGRNMKHLIEDNESMARVLESNAPAAAAMAEAKKAREMHRILQSTIDGLMNEKNVAIRQVRALQRKYGQEAA